MKNRFYLLDYVKENFDLDKDIFDSLKYALDSKIYYYGDHFRYPNEIKNERYFLKSRLYSCQKDFKFLLKNIFSKPEPIKNNGKKILFHSYFNVSEFYDNLSSMKFDVYHPFWINNKNLFELDSYKKYLDLRNGFENKNFHYLISKNFVDRIIEFKSTLTKKYKDFGFDGLIVPFDLPFFENISIQVFKELKKPSFVFLHGLPGVYNNIDNNRADYLIVWSEKIKDNFVKAGIDSNKIFVSGNAKYKLENFRKNLRFSLNNILIITKSMNGAQHGDEQILTDRGNLILYLYQIQNVLQKLGVKQVRFRPHPSENGNWYLQYLDKNFYKLDTENLKDSLNKSSLVIGPTSTVLLDSVTSGVNYVLYEPNADNVDLINYKLVPPFDGTDERVPLARTEEELKFLISDKKFVDIKFIEDYVKPDFNINFLKDLI